MTQNQSPPPNQPTKGKSRAYSPDQASVPEQPKASASLFSAFATPGAVSGSLAAASSSKTSVRGQTSAPASASADLFASVNARAQPSYRHEQFRETADSGTDAQRQFEDYTAGTLHDSQLKHEPAYVDENDGDAVLAFLSSSRTTSDLYSPSPDARRGPAQAILTDILVAADPVEYLLHSSSYTQDVWGDDWEEFNRAKEEAKAGKEDGARARVGEIIGRLKARL